MHAAEAPGAQCQMPGGRGPVVPRISVEEATPLCVACSALFVDARSATEYQAGHITGALHIAPGDPVDPVLWRDEIENIYAAGGSIFVEFGPKNILTNLVDNILTGRPHLAVALTFSPPPQSKVGHPASSDSSWHSGVPLHFAVAGTLLPSAHLNTGQPFSSEPSLQSS